MAFFLDSMKIDWKYESKSFLLKNGRGYLPDFYLPKIKTWIEVKGSEKQLSSELYDLECFVREHGKQMLIILPTKVFFIAEEDCASVTELQDTYVLLCSKCGEISFCGKIGSWHCRGCGFHDGDHDIKSWFSGKNDERNTNFYDRDSFKKIGDVLGV